MDDKEMIKNEINGMLDNASLKELRLLFIVVRGIVSVKGKQSE